MIAATLAMIMTGSEKRRPATQKSSDVFWYRLETSPMNKTTAR